MNVDTGKVYTEPEEIQEALDRGENLVPVSQRVAELVSYARKARTNTLKNKRKATRRAQRGK